MSTPSLSSSQRVLWIAILTALILISAAVLKWISPTVRTSYFYLIISGLEIVGAIVLVAYRNFWRVWVVLVLMLATWSGFSLYTTIFGLPCSCLGSFSTLHRGISLSLNGFMLIGAWHVLTIHPAQPIHFKKIIWFFVLFSILGFLLSLFYYNYRKINF